MVKKLIIVVLLLITLPKGYAQGQFRKPLKPQGRANSSALSKYAIGVKGGCPWSVMPKSDLQMVSYDGYFGYAAGLVVERYFNRFSISLETLFSKKGTKMHYDYPYQTGFNSSAIFHRDFLLDFSTITARIPVTYYFKGTFKSDKVVPYLFLGLQVDFPKDKITTYTTTTTYDSQSQPMTSNVNLSPNASTYFGFGFMSRLPLAGTSLLLKFDIAANYGLIDLAAQKLTLKNIDNCIRLHDIEANAAVILPIKKRLHDASWSFRQRRRLFKKN